MAFNLPTVQPANVFGSYVQGQQARQQSDMNAMRMQGAQREQAKEGLLALAAVYKKSNTPEEFQQGVTALQKMGFLDPGETIEYDQGLALLSKVFGPQADAWGNAKVVGRDVVVPDGVGGFRSAYRSPEGPKDRRIVSGSDGRSYYADTGEPVLPNDPGKQPTFRPATPEELAQYGASAGQIDTNTGRFYPGKGEGIEFTSPDGTTVRIGGSGGGSPKLTEQQSKDLVYYQRATGAAPKLNELEGALTGIGDNIASRLGGVGNYLKSPEYQQAEQAGREWLAAILRKDTGAAITQQEFDLYGPMYLPQPGDGPEVIAQKRVARQRAADAIKTGLGTAQVLLESSLSASDGDLSSIPTERLIAIREMLAGSQ